VIDANSLANGLTLKATEGAHSSRAEHDNEELALGGFVMASAGASLVRGAEMKPGLEKVFWLGAPLALGSIAFPAMPIAQIVAANNQSAVASTALDVGAVNDAQFEGFTLLTELSNLTIKVQVLLDRAGASPGVIDGIAGDNVRKAIKAFEAMRGLPVDGVMDNAVWAALTEYDDRAILVEYTVTSDDLAGPFLGEIPTDFAEMAALDRLSFSSPVEMYSERFHMDIDLLRALNPEADALSPGSVIVVAAVGENVLTPVARLEADVSGGQLRGYDSQDRLLRSSRPSRSLAWSLNSDKRTNIEFGSGLDIWARTQD
jgi:hypothetical protein